MKLIKKSGSAELESAKLIGEFFKEFDKFDLTFSSVNIDPNLTYGIIQGEAGVTDATSGKPVLATQGCNPCVAVSIYNETTKTAAIAHVDGIASPAQVIGLLVAEACKDGGILFVDLATGTIDNNSILEKIKKIVDENPQKLKLRKVYKSDGLAIDARTGTITEQISGLHFNKFEERVHKRVCETMHVQCQQFGSSKTFNAPITLVFNGGRNGFDRYDSSAPSTKQGLDIHL